MATTASDAHAAGGPQTMTEARSRRAGGEASNK